jgi:hypothetical protein
MTSRITRMTDLESNKNFNQNKIDPFAHSNGLNSFAAAGLDCCCDAPNMKLLFAGTGAGAPKIASSPPPAAGAPYCGPPIIPIGFEAEEAASWPSVGRAAFDCAPATPFGAAVRFSRLKSESEVGSPSETTALERRLEVVWGIGATGWEKMSTAPGLLLNALVEAAGAGANDSPAKSEERLLEVETGAARWAAGAGAAALIRREAAAAGAGAEDISANGSKAAAGAGAGAAARRDTAAGAGAGAGAGGLNSTSAEKGSQPPDAPPFADAAGAEDWPTKSFKLVVGAANSSSSGLASASQAALSLALSSRPCLTAQASPLEAAPRPPPPETEPPPLVFPARSSANVIVRKSENETPSILKSYVLPSSDIRASIVTVSKCPSN